MLKKYLADLHVHSLLSPCAEIEMTPHYITLMAKEIGLDILAITDHNSSANIPALFEACYQTGIVPIAGMEVECKEEAHLLGLFANYRTLKKFQNIVDQHKTLAKNDAKFFGAQIVVDADDNFIREEEGLLLAPIDLTAEKIAKAINDLGGICLPAHVDRPSYSLLQTLGFISKEQGFAGYEISPRGYRDFMDKKKDRAIMGLNYIVNSDAHCLRDFEMSPRSSFYLAEPTFAEIKMALAQVDGRYITFI